ncbi:MAG TPA: Ig-like domain-containing protein [Bacteroidales bacterium]|nr:Ig-like domain-containing protein [Bacteroidales bacterium]
MKKNLLVLLSLLLVAFTANAQLPDRIGWWKFDDAGDMLKAETGSPLTLTGSQTSVAGPVETNLAAEIGPGSFLSMLHGMTATGEDSLVNEYSVLIDFSIPEAGIWHSFIQTTIANEDDADLFTRASDNAIGTGATGYSDNTVSASTWYRMVISVKNGEFFKVYLNGALWLDGTPQDIDGRWALDSTLLIFADNDGDDGTIDCAELAIWDIALTGSEVLQLGNAFGDKLVTAITVTGEGDASTIETDGGTLQMIATVEPADATNDSVAWSLTEGEDKASIDETGLLTAIKNGTVTVIATSTDGGNVSDSMDIVISNQPVVAVTSIEVTSEGDAETIETQGGTLQMYAQVLPDNATDKSVTWSVVPGTGDATIDQTGLLTAVSDGTVGVRATANDGSGIFGGTVIQISGQTVIRERKGLWKFDDASDMLKATIGQPLTLTGTQTSVEGPAAGNLATEVPLGSYLSMTHGIAANGGGSLVNEWSLQIDFSLPAIDTWYAFFQTLDGDADLFVAKTAAGDIGRVPNSIGCGSTLYSTNTVSANTWYRMIVSVKNGEFFKLYINGELWLDAAAQDIDGRYGLESVLGIFQDDDGDDGTIICSELGIWDVALSEGEAAGLGNPLNSEVTGIHNIENESGNLDQNYPNPFRQFTTLPYQVTKAGDVTFRVLDMSGKEVRTIREGYKTPGNYKVEFSRSNLSAGVYYVQMAANNTSKTIKMVITE